MQTTIDIPDDLYEQADLMASKEGVPLGDLITQGLRLALAETHSVDRQRIVFPLLRSARPGVLGVEEVRAAEGIVTAQEDASRAGSM